MYHVSIRACGLIKIIRNLNEVKINMSNLKITDIKLIRCGSLSFFKVYTNEEGITGLGESVIIYDPVLKGYTKFLQDLLIGEDPFNIEKIWRKLYSATFFFYKKAMFSPIDVALWDIKGKKLGVPLYDLLGGLYRDRVRVYPHLKGTWNTYPEEKTDRLYSMKFGTVKDLKEIKNNALELVEEGYTAIKFDPFPPGKDGFHGYRRSEIKEAIERVKAVYEAVPEDVDIIIEAHAKFNASTAIRIGKMLEEYNPMWYEEPVPPGYIESMLKVRNHINIPIAAGERLSSKTELKEYFEKGAFDILMFDLAMMGGITEARKMCAMAEAYQIKVSPHNCLGPVIQVASVHLSAAIPSFLILEDERIAPWAIKPRVKFENGYIIVPDRAGLGIELDEEEISKHQEKVDAGIYKDGRADGIYWEVP
jgi:galactonate dehydratase